MSRQRVREPKAGGDAVAGSIIPGGTWKTSPAFGRGTSRHRGSLTGDAGWPIRKEVVMYQKPTLQRFGTFREVADWVGLSESRRAS
jgi:hypothetical protein